MSFGMVLGFSTDAVLSMFCREPAKGLPGVYHQMSTSGELLLQAKQR